MIEHHDDDLVGFKITAFSRPATRLAKIAGPLGAMVQHQDHRPLSPLAGLVITDEGEAQKQLGRWTVRSALVLLTPC